MTTRIAREREPGLPVECVREVRSLNASKYALLVLLVHGYHCTWHHVIVHNMRLR